MRGLRHGRGRQTDAGGGSFVGDFADGHACGSGVHTSARGDVFRGRFAAGTRQGLGRLEYVNGMRLDAVYAEGVCRRARAALNRQFLCMVLCASQHCDSMQWAGLTRLPST